MSQMRTDILGHPPGLCNCRRVWHPCHTHAPYQGVQLSQLHQPSSHCIFPQNSQNFLAEENFCVFCVFRGTILRNLNICVHLCHLWEDYLGLPHAPTQGVQLSQLHQPSCHCIFPQNSQNTQKPLAEMYSHRIHRIFLQRRTSVYSACSMGQYYAT